jgi:hypothetical protein
VAGEGCLTTAGFLCVWNYGIWQDAYGCAWDWDREGKGNGTGMDGTGRSLGVAAEQRRVAGWMTWDGNGQRMGLGWVFWWHGLEMLLCFGMELVLGRFGSFMSGVLWAVAWMGWMGTGQPGLVHVFSLGRGGPALEVKVKHLIIFLIANFFSSVDLAMPDLLALISPSSVLESNVFMLLL